MSADIEPIFTTNLSNLEAAADKVLSEAAGTCSPGRRTSERAGAGRLAFAEKDGVRHMLRTLRTLLAELTRSALLRT